MHELIFDTNFCLRHKKRATDFTRERIFSFPGLILFQMNLSTKSLGIELTRFFSRITGNTQPSSGTKQSYSDARLKFSYTAYIELRDRLISAFYADNIFKRYKGYRLIAIDGSRLQLPNTPSLIEGFGIAENKGKTIPMAMTSVAYDVLNDLAIDAIIDGYATGERALADKHIARIKELLPTGKNIFLMDRGYRSLYLMAKLHVLGHDFLIRCSDKKFLTEVMEFAQSEVNDQIIVLDLTSGSRKYNQQLKQVVKEHSLRYLRLRIVKIILKDGTTELLITSLCNQVKWGRSALGALYNLRWNEETYFNFQKNVLEIENFSGKTPEAIRQDYYARVLVANVHSMLIQEAQDEVDEETKSTSCRKYGQYSINKSVATGILRDDIIEMLFMPGDEWTDRYQKLVAKIKKHIVPKVPGRSYPRNRKKQVNWFLKKRKVL